MSKFHGCHNLVTMSFTFRIIIFFFLEYMASPILVAGTGRDDMYDLYSREEMVELAGYGEDKLSNVLVTGTLRCISISSPSLAHQPSEPISGVLVEVICSGSGSMKEKQARVKGITDEYGDFIIELPSQIHGLPNLNQACSVELHSLPNSSPCQSAFPQGKQTLQLSSVGNGVRTYTVGEIMLRSSNMKQYHISIEQ